MDGSAACDGAEDLLRSWGLWTVAVSTFKAEIIGAHDTGPLIRSKNGLS